MPRNIASHRCRGSRAAPVSALLRLAAGRPQAQRAWFPASLRQASTLVLCEHLQGVARLQAVGRERAVVLQNTSRINEARLGWGKAVLVMDEILNCLDGGRGGGVQLVLVAFQVLQHQLEHARGLFCTRSRGYVRGGREAGFKEVVVDIQVVHIVLIHARVVAEAGEALLVWCLGPPQHTGATHGAGTGHEQRLVVLVVVALSTYLARQLRHDGRGGRRGGGRGVGLACGSRLGVVASLVL